MTTDIIKRLREAIAEHPLSPIHGYGADIVALVDRLDQSEKERPTLWEAIGLASTIKGDMEIDTSDPLGMMQQVARHADGLARENERLLKAIHEKGGTEHAPTQWAYDQACAALNRAKEENKALREALLPFVDEGIELNCDECGGDQNKCNASCVVRKGRAVLDAAMAAER